jgi:anion-transporting  ArsA/GET3 family ATPase
MRRLVTSKQVLVCVGPGGVGKTTTAAALGVLAARLGRRTLVCTIDPAPRLADALGMPELGPEPRTLAPDFRRRLGIVEPGSLQAVRVDTDRTFARLVEEQVTDAQLRGRILANPMYRQMIENLTGAQEYAATLFLFELQNQRAYDLIILDTPPTANALDFLATPHRLAEAISSPAVQWLTGRKDKTHRFSLQRLGMGGALILRRAGKLLGSQFIDDLGTFLLDVRDVLGAFLARARQIESLLRQPDVGFLLVLTPETAAINEALYLAGHLRQAGTPLEGFVANRVLAPPGLVEAGALAAELARLPSLAGIPRPRLTTAAGQLASLGSYLAHITEQQQKELDRLLAQAPGLPITRVPLQPHDISNLDSLKAVADCFGALE